MMNDDIATYQSPFSTRYGTEKMRVLFSEMRKRIEWRRAWMELAEFQGMPKLSKEEWYDVLNYTVYDYVAALAEESKTHHDLVAELHQLEGHCSFMKGNRAIWLHQGITSSDIEDTADGTILREASREIQTQINQLIRMLLVLAQTHESYVILARTHLQLAEPTTLGYRFLWYAYQLHYVDVSYPHYKFMAGAVGTGANLRFFDTRSPENSLPVFQTAPRQWDLELMAKLSQVASVLNKMAFDIRVMSMEGLVSEGKTESQVGSSAMPGKTNPIKSEKICGLARLFPGWYNAVWDYAACSLLERTLDDSSTRRVVLPEAFLAMSEMLQSAYSVIRNLETPRRPEPAEMWKTLRHEWEAWAPSRVVAYLRSQHGGEYSKVYKEVEDSMDVVMGLTGFLGYWDIHLSIQDLARMGAFIEHNKLLTRRLYQALDEVDLWNKGDL
jgi:adenylosuccinate lyase